MRKFNFLVAMAAFSFIIGEGAALAFSGLSQCAAEVEIVPPEASTVTQVCEERLTEDEIALIALVTMAEAEDECEEGKRLVIDTVLNRVASEHFPNTVAEVVYQPYHFSSMWNGRADRCCVNEDICHLVREELRAQTNYDVIFFTAGQYSEYGVPLFRVENHYFSSYS